MQKRLKAVLFFRTRLQMSLQFRNKVAVGSQVDWFIGQVEDVGYSLVGYLAFYHI